MTTVLWDTDATEIVKTLAAERRAAGALASGLALTLVTVVDEQHVPAALDAATTAAAAHPCRLLVVVRRKLAADDRLDAEVQVGGLRGANESVVMRMYGRLTLHAESVVLPLLASDAPVVTWWHGATTPDRLAYDALSTLASRRVTDTASSQDPVKALKVRAKDYAPGDTDLAWTRATPWRALLAAAFDDISEDATSAEVRAEKGNPSAQLVAGWLSSRLGVQVRRSTSPGPGVTAVQVRFSGGDVLRLDRPDGYLATLSRTGMPDRQLPLKRRELGDLLAEELRRLDADQPYAEALAAVTGESAERLAERPAKREHIWRDPERAAARRTTASGKKSTAKRAPAARAKKATAARKTTGASAKKAPATRKAGTAKKPSGRRSS